VAPRWEYHVEVVGSFWRGARPDDIQELLTEAAEDEWEPVELAPIQNSSRLMIVLRRPAVRDRRKVRERTWP
jgi:hypothetical protein